MSDNEKNKDQAESKGPQGKPEGKKPRRLNDKLKKKLEKLKKDDPNIYPVF